TLAPAVGIGTATAVAWNYVTDSKISNTAFGAAALAAVATLPAAFSYLRHLPDDDNQSDVKDLAKAAGISVAAAGVVALARSSEILNANTDVGALSAAVTFPAAYLFFKFRERNQYGQQQGQALARAAVTSYAVGGAVSLMATPRL
ncbi:MAG TPA: hypothetical protein VLG38_06750, partial [Gammaproteobacteria bacterium]|nr:hypothetical protein [Gammaproteobacteria bacterium]